MISDEFITYFSKLKFSRIKNDFGIDSEVLKSYSANIKDGRFEDKPYSDLRIIFPENESGYKKEQFIKDGEALFKYYSLSFSDKIFFVVLFGFQFYKNIPKNMINGLKAGFKKYMNTSISSCKVYAVFPLTRIILNPENFQEIKLNTFKIGKFEINKFKTIIQKETGSDYYDIFLKDNVLDEEKSSNLLSFSKEIYELNIINFPKLFPSHKVIEYEDVILLFNDFYFDALTFDLFNKFWKEFEKEQIISLANGLSFFDPTYYRSLSLGNGIQVAIYHKINKDKSGWVVPMIPSTDSIISFSQSDISVVNEKSEKIFSSLKIESNFSSILNQLINFLAKGNYELSVNKFSEAILSYWVGLDIILNNTEEANSLMLKNRVSALLWYSENSSHNSVFFKIQKSYIKRSKYVHAGELVSETDAVFLRSACQTILDILIRIHTNSSKNKNFTYDSWILNLDELIHAGRNSTNVPSELLKNIGIID